MDSQMAFVKSISGSKAIVELGSGEVKTASIPRGLSVSLGHKALIMQVAGKYLIINTY